MIFARRGIDDAAWRGAVAEFSMFDRLSDPEIERLRGLAEKFLRRKSLEGAQGLDIEPWMAAELAAQACLPVLGLDLDYFQGWRSLIVYPGGFLVRHSHEDEAGVVHEICEERVGEAWEEGPVIVSWEDVDASRRGGSEGFNVVIHELAHKLDALTGSTNGLPPLHRDMDVATWSSVFNKAYEQLGRCVDRGDTPPIDAYATESPAEFFSVVSEYFFTLPEALRVAFPPVYGQLARFYRQDPLGDGSATNTSARPAASHAAQKRRSP